MIAIAQVQVMGERMIFVRDFRAWLASASQADGFQRLRIRKISSSSERI